MLAVVTLSFISNVAGLLDLTLKHIDNLDYGNKTFHTLFACSKLAKKTPATTTTRQIYSKLTLKI